MIKLLFIFFLIFKVFANDVRVISLNDAIKMALKNNKKYLLNLELTQISAKNSYLDAKAEYNRPSIDANCFVNQKTEVTGTISQKILLPITGTEISLDNTYKNSELKNNCESNVNITLSQPLSPKEVLTNRKILRDIKENYENSLLSIEKIKENFIVEIINNYVNFMKQEINKEHNKKRREIQKELFKIANLRYKAGEIPKIDIMSFELQNKMENLNILEEEENYRKTKKEFLKFLGIENDIEFKTEFDIEPFLEVLPPINETINKAKNHQLREAKLNLKRKQEFLREAQLSHNLSFFLQGGFTTKNWEKPSTTYGLWLKIKFYDAGRYKRNLQLLQKEFEIEQYNFQELNKKVEDEVYEVYKKFELINQQKEFLKSMEEISFNILEAGKFRFQMGVTSQSELNNVMESYAETTKKITDIKIESFFIKIQYLTLVGEIFSYFGDI